MLSREKNKDAGAWRQVWFISLRLLLRGGQDMKKAINLLIAGCLLGAIVIGPFNIYDASGFSVEASPALAFVTGVVTDEGGKPLAGAIVAVLEPRMRGKEIRSAKTDTQGRF